MAKAILSVSCDLELARRVEEEAERRETSQSSVVAEALKRFLGLSVPHQRIPTVRSSDQKGN